MHGTADCLRCALKCCFAFYKSASLCCGRLFFSCNRNYSCSPVNLNSTCLLVESSKQFRGNALIEPDFVYDPNALEPAARAIWSGLLAEISDFKARIASLSTENALLREQLAAYAGKGVANSPVRKQAKASSHLKSTTNVIVHNCSNTDGDPSLPLATDGEVNIASRPTVVGNKNKNRKKIIQAIDTNIVAVRNSIKEAKCEQFSLKQTKSNAPIKIVVTQSDEVPIILEALKKANTSYHEYKWDSEKNKCFVIRGLTCVTAEELNDIYQELLSAGVPAESTLTLLTTGYMCANPDANHNTLLKLVVPPNFDDQLLKTIKFIDHMTVSFEKLKSKPVVQCKNCQRFGHSAGGCQHNHRCVKCGENHLRDQCPRTLNKSVKLVCCNCGGEHTANNLPVCSYFQKMFVKPTDSQPVPASKKQTIVSKDANNSAYAAVSGRDAYSASSNQAKSYAAVARAASKLKWDASGNQQAAANLSDIAKKLDLIMEMVTRHEVLLQNLHSHE